MTAPAAFAARRPAPPPEPSAWQKVGEGTAELGAGAFKGAAKGVGLLLKGVYKTVEYVVTEIFRPFAAIRDAFLDRYGVKEVHPAPAPGSRRVPASGHP